MRKKIVEIKSTIIGIATGIALGVALVLTGCGNADDTSADADTARVVEKIDDYGNVVGIKEVSEEDLAEAEVDDSSEEVASAGISDSNEMVESEATAIEESTADNSSEDSSSEEDSWNQASTETRNLEVLSGAKDYLKYMSDAELRGLALEALDAADLDTRLAEGRMKTTGVEFEVPEGFEESEQVKGMYITGRYPIDATNIYYAETDVDYTLQLMDKDSCAELIKQKFASVGGQDVEVKINEFEQIMINGVPTFRILAEYDLEDYHLIQLIYMINGSKTYNIVYTMTSEYDRMELFEESASTIKVNRAYDYNK